VNRLAPLLLMALPGPAWAHAFSEANARFVEAISGPAFAPFTYLGAKHMVTGYDHLLFLVGVVFFLHRLKDIVVYVTMFTVGHSVTLLFGVLTETTLNAYLIDGIIGLSIVYKAFENLGGFDHVIKLQFDTRIAVLVFGLAHGLGLATKVLELTVSDDGLVTNILSFNLGVEIGQVLVLAFVVFVLNQWRKRPSFDSKAVMANTLLMASGFLLAGYQFSGFWLG
jgi:hypothetical protein